MVKKLLEISLGNWSETTFVYKGQRIMDLSKLPEILDRECSPYENGDIDGVVVYFSDREYQELKKNTHVEE